MRFEPGAFARFLRPCLASLILALAGNAGHAVEPAPLPVEQIAPGNFVHYGSLDDRSPANLGDQANVGFIVGERCVAVIDTGGSLAVGRMLAAAVRAVTDKPVCYVVITHFHPDHFFGAGAFRGPDVQVVAHEGHARAANLLSRPYVNALRRDLGELADGSIVIPASITVSRERRLDLGGRVLRLQAWPVSHTNNDITVLDEATGTLWLGDLLFLDHTPVVDGSVSGFLEVMRALAAIPAGSYVAGHGRPTRPWPEALDRQRGYLEAVVRDTRAALKARMSLEQATETVGWSQAAGWVNFDLYHPRNVSAAYTELEWE
jgi:quinoprotein relay system zinc metallohydrolase 2